MGVGWNQVSKIKCALARRLDQDALVKWGVTRRRDDPDAFHDLLFTSDEFDFVRRFERRVVAIEVAGGCPLIGMRGVLVLPALDDVGRVWKADLDLTVRPQTGVAAGVIEVEVCVNDEDDVGRSNAYVRQAILQHRQMTAAFVLESIDVLELFVLLIARSRVDEDETGRMFDEEAAHAHLNAVALVGGNVLFPERLGDDTEHGAAIQLLPTCPDGVNRQRADFAALEPRPGT